MKETRVYVCSIDEYPDLFNNINIATWNNEDELSFEAIDFINKAEHSGRVYSLEGFQNAFNDEEISDVNDFIFITNKY